MDDIHQTARDWFMAKTVNGEQPQTLSAHGVLDGLSYYEVEVDGVRYWLTEQGLFDPPIKSDSE